MANFATKVAQISSIWPILVNFQLFPQKAAQIVLEWPISPDLQLFQSFLIKVAHFSPNFKIFISRGVIHPPISPDLQLFESFPTEVAQNDPQWPILQPKWLGLAQNGQFSTFAIFSHKKAAQIDSEWPILPDSQLFQSFPTKAAHFLPNFKIFISRRGVQLELVH